MSQDWVLENNRAQLCEAMVLKLGCMLKPQRETEKQYRCLDSNWNQVKLLNLWGRACIGLRAFDLEILGIASFLSSHVCFLSWTLSVLFFSWTFYLLWVSIELLRDILEVQFSLSVMFDSLRPHRLQHTRLPSPSPAPGAYSSSCSLSWWCHPTISSFVFPFSFHLQSFPASGSFQMSQFFASGGQSIGVSASASVLPMNI